MFFKFRLAAGYALLLGAVGLIVISLAAGIRMLAESPVAPLREARNTAIGDDSPITDNELFHIGNSRMVSLAEAYSGRSGEQRRARDEYDRQWRAKRERAQREESRLRGIEYPDLWKAANQETRWQLRCPINVRFDHEELADVLVGLTCESEANIVIDPRLLAVSGEWPKLLVSGGTGDESPLWVVLTDLIRPLGLIPVADFDRVVVTTLDFADEWLVGNEQFTAEWHEIPYTGKNNQLGKVQSTESTIEQLEFVDEIRRTIEPDTWVASRGRGWIEHCAPLDFDGGSLVGDNPDAIGYYLEKNLDSGILVFSSHVVHSIIRCLIDQRTIEEQAVFIEEQRELYPYDSMRHRLAYETSHKRGGEGEDSAPAMSVAASRRLNSHENRFGKGTDKGGAERDYVDSERRDSLEMLHSTEVSKFISRARLGMMRSPPPRPQYLALPSGRDIPFAKVPTLSSPILATKFFDSPSEIELRGNRQPNEAVLTLFHRRGFDRFFDPYAFGHIIDRDHVAGFGAHAFRELPTLPDRFMESKLPYLIDRWLVGRLELVSLLKFAEPAVYVSEHLPRMDKLVDAKTRQLNSFESEALSTLQSGEDLSIRYSLNHIQMVGSLRAMKQCLDCHQVQRGELLGAFSYDLWRDPPSPEVSAQAASGN